MTWRLIPLGLILAACDPTPPPQPEIEPKPNQVFETQIQAMEKARAMESQVHEAADAQRQKMDAATSP